MKKILCYIILLLVLAWVNVIQGLPISRLSRKGYNVMVLHSYNSTYVWCESVTRGLREYFEAASDEKINLYLEYLDAKRYPDDSYLENMYEVIKEKYQSISDFDLVIAVDNQSLSFMQKYGEDIFSGLPVVFCGINHLEHFDLSQNRNYTGVSEDIRPDLTVEQILNLQPEVTKLFVVSDCNTKTGIAAIQQSRVRLEKYNSRLEIEYPLNYTMGELEGKLSSLDRNYAVLLLIFNLDREGDFFEVEEAAELISQSASVPVYVCWDFYIGKGVVGGAIISGYDQGKEAAGIALRILNGEAAEDIPIVQSTPVRYIYDQTVIDKYNLRAGNLSKKAIIINKKENYLQVHWKTLLIFLGIISAMVFYIISLLRTQRNLKQSRQHLRQKDMEWRELADSLPGFVFRMDRQMRFLYINSFFEDLLNMTPGEIIGRHLTELPLSDEIINVNLEAINAVLEKREAQKVEFKFGIGSEIRAFETSIQPEFGESGEINSLLGIIYDLTERYKTEQELKNSEQRATEARRIARLGYWELDIIKEEISWSSELSEILGIEHEPSNQTLGNICAQVHLPKRELLREIKRRELTGEFRSDEVYRIINAQDQTKYLHVRGKIITNRAGLAISIYGTIQDITSEKLAEQQIRSSEAKFRAIYDHAPMGISLIDENICFAYNNSTLLKMSKFQESEIEGKSITTLVYEDDREKCLKSYQELFSGAIEQFTFRKRLLCKDGSLLWTLTTVTLFYTEEEARYYAISMETDINDFVLAEQMVAESEQFLKEAQQIAKFGYWKYDPATREMNCSAEMLHILGYKDISNNQISQEEFVSYFSESDRLRFLEQLQHCVMIRSRYESATRITNRAQEQLQVNIRMESQSRDNGHNYVLGTFIDITVMKSIESQLRKVEARFRLFFENSPLGIIILDRTNQINLYNPAFRELLQLGDKQAESIRLGEFLSEQHSLDFDSVIKSIDLGERESVTAEYQLKRQDGKYIWCSLTIARWESETASSYGTMILIEDIDERKKARESLKESEEKYRSVFEVSRDGLILTNNDTGKIIEVNSSAAEMFGCSKEELYGRKLINLTSDPLKLDNLLRSREQFILGEWGLARDGDKFPMEISLNYFQRKRINYHIASVRNITERLQFESELQESEKKFRTIIENAPLGIIFVDENARIIFSNRVIQKMLGREKDSELERLESLLVVERWDFYKVVLEEIFAGNRTSFFEELHILRQDGSMFWGNILISVVRTAAKKPDFAIIMIQDVTEQREIEEKLHLYEKLESIGQLAGMIAHDFNNQLMGVLGYSTILQERLKDEELREYAKMIYKSAETSAALTQKLLSFARKGRQVTINQDMHKLIKETYSLVRATIPAKISFTLELAAKSMIISSDPGQIQNALLNLILNACDAMPHGGELKISTRNEELDKNHSSGFFEEVFPGRYIKVSIADTGQGMTEEIRKRIFEPFFTTKKEGKGTGLGLPAVFGAVKSHQGYISFDTYLDKGTTFDLYFPLADIQVEEELTAKTAGYSIHGSGNIVLIDDEEIVRNTVETLLESLGYKVFAFSDGKGALGYYQENWEEIDLILLDVIMPEMDGPAVFSHLREINPAAKVVLFSAYSSTAEVQKTLDNGALGFIHKPILRDELSQKIAQAMADQRVNNLSTLFGIREARRVEINKPMLNAIKKSIIEQFGEIMQELQSNFDDGDKEKIEIMLRSLVLFLRKTKIKKMGVLIKRLQSSLKSDRAATKDILQQIEKQFLIMLE